MGGRSIRHGYTNATRIDGERVVKRYLAMDAAERMRAEVDAIQRTAGRVPVPEIVHVDGADCVVTFRRCPRPQTEAGNGHANARTATRGAEP